MSPLQQPTWEDVYQSTPIEEMPWFFADLDPDIDRALQAIGGMGTHVLDIGTGPGTQAIELAKRNFQVVGTDISSTAIEKAIIRAREHNVEVDFRVDNILDTDLHGPFDYILDRGVFHTFDPSARPQYAQTVYQLLRPEAYLLLKCFSHLEPGTRGPHRLSPEDLRHYFQKQFTIVSIEHTTFAGTYPAQKALFAVMERRS